MRVKNVQNTVRISDGVGLFVFCIVLQDQTDTVTFLFGQQPVGMDNLPFLPGEFYIAVRGIFIWISTMPNQIINAGFKVISDFHQGTEIRFYIVIFILIDGLLADSDYIGKLLLTDTFIGSKLSQITDYRYHPVYMVTISGSKR